MRVGEQELIVHLVAHGIGVDVDGAATTEPVPLDKLAKMIGYMLDNEFNGNGKVKDMAMLIARMANRLRANDKELAEKAIQFLVDRDLVGTPLRAELEDIPVQEHHRGYRQGDPLPAVSLSGLTSPVGK